MSTEGTGQARREMFMSSMGGGNAETDVTDGDMPAGGGAAPLTERFASWWTGAPSTQPAPDTDAETSDPDEDPLEEEGSSEDPAAPTTFAGNIVSWWNGDSTAPSHTNGPTSVPSLLNFKERFITWWDGEDADSLRREPHLDVVEDAAEPSDTTADEEPETTGPWPERRRRLAEQIWGPGYTMPGGKQESMALVKALGLKPTMTILDITAGLGGRTRLYSTEYKLWITGLELNPDLADAGYNQSVRAGLADKAPINFIDPKKLAIAEKQYDRIIGYERFFTLENRQEVLGILASALKKNGQFIFTDFALADDERDQEVIDAWSASEPERPHLWTMSEYAAHLGETGLMVRTADDRTELYAAMIESGWAQFAKKLERGKVDRKQAMLILSEAELWVNRLRALRSGSLRFLRIHTLA